MVNGDAGRARIRQGDSVSAVGAESNIPEAGAGGVNPQVPLNTGAAQNDRGCITGVIADQRNAAGDVTGSPRSKDYIKSRVLLRSQR